MSAPIRADRSSASTSSWNSGAGLVGQPDAGGRRRTWCRTGRGRRGRSSSGCDSCAHSYPMRPSDPPVRPAPVDDGSLSTGCSDLRFLSDPRPILRSYVRFDGGGGGGGRCRRGPRCSSRSPSSTRPTSTPPTSPTSSCARPCRSPRSRSTGSRAVLTRCVAAGEARQVHAADGMGSMKTWLTGHCRLSGAEARRPGPRRAPAGRPARARGGLRRRRGRRRARAGGDGRRDPGADRGGGRRPGSTWPPPTACSPKRPGCWVRRTPGRRLAAGWRASTPTGCSTTPRACRGCCGWRPAAAGGSTSPGTSTRSAARRCTPHWRP